jgi:hypothetical protein
MTDFIFPPPYIPDPSQGRPLSNASLFFGLPDLDPEILANQVPVSVIQENGVVVPVAQPIMTGSGGVPLYNGSPVEISVSVSEYSFKALNSQGGQVYFIPRIEESLEQQLADLELRVDDLEQDVSDLNQEDIAIRATQGVALGAVNLGSFPGSLIPNNQTVKGAFTTLEDEAQDVRTLTGTALGSTNLGSFSSSLLPSSLNLKSTLDGFAENIQDIFDETDISAVGSSQGQILIPYTATNAILIKWGSQTVSGNSTATVNFANDDFTAIYQAVATHGFDIGNDAQPVSVFNLLPGSLTLRNSDGTGGRVNWWAVGRLAL